MDERVIQFRVGVMVFATLIIAAILVVMFGELPKIIHGEYTIYVTFDEAPGVTEDTPVRKNGIFIGRVKRVEFTKDEHGRPDAAVVVTCGVQANRRLYRNDVCFVQSNLLGDATLEFTRSTDPNLPTGPLQDDVHLKGMVRSDPTKIVANLEMSLADTIGSVNSAADQLKDASSALGVTLGKVDGILDDNREGLKKAVDEAAHTLASVGKAADVANRLLGDEASQERFRQALDQLPAVIDQTHKTVLGMQNTMGLVDSNLENIQQFTSILADEEVLNRMAQLMDQLALFSEKLNDPKGTLGRLMSDPELYCHLNRAAKNVDQLTAQLKPILADARVFSDKIARHPELLGVRGAMQKNPGIK